MEFLRDPLFWQQHLDESLMISGLVLLIIEATVLGFSTFVLLFLGVALLVTGGLMELGWLANTLPAALWCGGLLTVVLAITTWKPLKRLQKPNVKKAVQSDFANITLILERDLPANPPLMYAYSGIQWQLKSDVPIAQGTTVQVVKKEVGVLWVAPLEV